MFIDTLKAIDPDQLRLNNHEAADILHNVTRAYDAIFKRFEQSCTENKTLYVMIGESHSYSAHHIAHTLLIRALNDITTAPIITALECPINLKASNAPELKNKLYNKNALCKTSAANIAFLQEHVTSECAPYASSSFEASLCHQQDRLVTIFNDIACTDDNHLNLTGIKSQKYIDQNHDIAPESRHGVALRNIHMHEHLMAATEKFQSPLAIQICGQAHINGSLQLPPRESISGLLREKEQNMFAVFWRAATAMPMHFSPCDFYIAENMPDRFIQYHVHNTKENFSAKDLENYTLEKDYVHGVYKSLGIKPPL